MLNFRLAHGIMECWSNGVLGRKTDIIFNPKIDFLKTHYSIPAFVAEATTAE